MYLITHGGKCCGIKAIHALPYLPMRPVSALEDEDLCTFRVTSESNGYFDYRNPAKKFYDKVAPMESGEERLRRYLAYLDEVRPQGVTEIVLTTYTGNAHPAAWEPLLLSLGFKAVNSCKNSNSKQTITIYHRNSGEVPPLSFGDKVEKKKAVPLRPAVAVATEVEEDCLDGLE
jgi:hypothetical protein